MFYEAGTAFDVLAEICSLLSKEDERKCEISWETADEDDIRSMIEKYEDLVKAVLNSSNNEYKFNKAESVIINAVLKKLREELDIQDVLFHLAIAIEQSLGAYSGWLNNKVFHALTPLNNNADETGIEILPRIVPFWNLSKSERNRAHTLNSRFKNYMIIRKEDLSPFQLDAYYWNDSGLIDNTEFDFTFSVALTPVMDYAKLDTSQSKTQKGSTIIVNGLQNKKIVTERVLDIFDKLFEKKYSVIVFTECLGTTEIVDEIKQRMRTHPEVTTLVILPTICENEKNTLIVLGPGGTECLRHNKATPFILIDKDSLKQREQLEYDNHIPVLITKELGMMVFPICAEFLDPGCYKVMTEIAMGDTIICPAFSPGVQAFADTMIKGTPMKLLQFFVNTCSAKEVSRNGAVAEPLGMVQLPYIVQRGGNQDISLFKIKKECTSSCCATLCYFDIVITYDKKTEKFSMETSHCLC